MNEETIYSVNREIKNNNILRELKYYEPNKYYDFKECKEITNHFGIVTNSSGEIKFNPSFPLKHFITGVSFQVDMIPNFPECLFSV
jgi:hypothetical protein